MSRGRVYLDTSGALKLFLPEPESDALWDWLAGFDDAPVLVSSALLGVEMQRAVRRADADAADVVEVETFLASHVDFIRISRRVLDRAGRVPPVRLRSLDAIHLATALGLGDSLDAMVTYDKLLAEAAESAGLPVAAPGAA